MSRIFNFGCSFTNYSWPTWADLLAYKNQGYNLGICGSGNVSILYRVLEADRVFKFTPDDQIIIMFTSPARWDRITGSPLRFSVDGQVLNASEDLIKLKDKFYTIEGLCIESFYSILAVKNYLENKKINFLFGSILDIFSHLDNYISRFKINTTSEFEYLSKHVKEEVPFELLDMYSFIQKENGASAKKDWDVTKKWSNLEDDYHPRPVTHYKYLQKEILPKLSFELKVDLKTVNLFETTIDNSSTFSQCAMNFKEIYPNIVENRVHPNVYIDNKKI